MKSKIMIAATIAALSLTTVAFAQTPSSSQAAGFPADVGSNAYPVPNPALSFAPLGMPILPVYGSEGAVQTANSLPSNFTVGTVAYAQGEHVKQWFAQQDTNRRVAQLRTGRPNG
jgi:hypothetical protein